MTSAYGPAQGPDSSCYYCTSPCPPLYRETIEEHTAGVVRKIRTVVCEQHRAKTVAS